MCFEFTKGKVEQANIDPVSVLLAVKEVMNGSSIRGSEKVHTINYKILTRYVEQAVATKKKKGKEYLNNDRYFLWV